ncbi:class I SAM-dependent DNA methyltransferase [Arthrobacter cryoconiti]|uniref:Class I SAM-dependent DNA methyltransferase n=1 Tax=Arthrobacter cryoconiti TaxID=748907 RepID=A0ABV8QXX6_9MICC|nr:class I SAM-dependent methyltransferase [Arthrobacter cryoconiti]MCC9068182.1 class I SAM-dependent methyltransferase [Arthrobacter cryoconiti]
MNEPRDITRTRAAYDAVAVSYEQLLRGLMAEKPYDRGVLSIFAERVRGTGNLTVLDAGCGPGRVAGYLDSCGVSVRGIDLSPGMVEVARRSYPSINFAVGTVEALDAAPGELGGILAWYSLIHTPPQRRRDVFDGFARALIPGGFLLLAFQVGDTQRHIEHAYGHAINLDAFLMDPQRIEILLESAGFAIEARLVREADKDEHTPQAYLIARARN